MIYLIYDIITFINKVRLEINHKKNGYFKINNTDSVSDMGHLNYCILDNSVAHKTEMTVNYVFTGENNYCE